MKQTLLQCASVLILGSALLAGLPPAYGQTPPSTAVASDMIFDVRNGDQNGKLILKDTEVAFESLTDSRHSRNWKYSDIRELSRKKKEMRIAPVKGSKYDFQFKNSQTRDKIYDLISQRILAARQGARK